MRAPDTINNRKIVSNGGEYFIHYKSNIYCQSYIIKHIHTTKQQIELTKVHKTQQHEQHHQLNSNTWSALS